MASDMSTETTPRYRVIRDTVEQSIRSGLVPEGLVIIEKPLADIFGTSRAPVRRALAELHDRGFLQLFDGRGYLAGQNPRAKPLRRRLEPEMLGLGDELLLELNTPTLADRIHDEVQQVIATAMAFGQFRIQTAELADHYGVSRTVIREVLMRLKDRHVIGKDSTGHWIAGPLTAKAVREDYEIRRLLEPASLLSSAPQLTHEELAVMYRRLEGAMTSKEGPTITDLREIELDLHERCLRHNKNSRLRAIIQHSQLPLIVNHVFFSVIGPSKDSPALSEHALVIEHLKRKAYNAAAASLEAHLTAAAERTRQRLKALSVFPEPVLPSFLVRVG